MLQTGKKVKYFAPPQHCFRFCKTQFAIHTTPNGSLFIFIQYTNKINSKVQIITRIVPTYTRYSYSSLSIHIYKAIT